MISEETLGEESIRQDLEVLTVSKRLVTSVSQKLKKKIHKSEDEGDARGGAVNCLSISVGCRVADTGEDFHDLSNKRLSSASEEGKGLMTICGTEETRLDCFSYGVKERFWKKYNRKYLADSAQDYRKHIFLPDDILEMCLMRLPLTSLLNAQLVCKNWRSMATTQRFLQLRREGSFQTPWLFLFAALKDGCSSGEIHGYDVSQDKWHRVESDLLKGRYMYSVTSIHEEVYIIGGRSMDRNSFKSHRGILVFNPSSKSWRKIASMRHARSLPIVGATEVTSEFSTLKTQQNRQNRRFHLSRVSGESDVYEDPHRLSVRRQPADQNGTKSHSLTRQKVDRLNRNISKRFVLIAIGGTGLFDEPLDSGEIYDSATNTWSEIQRLPMDFGIVSCGIICNGIFYAYSENDKLSGYDIERGFWIAIQTSPIPPRVHEFYPKLVSCNHRLFMLSVSWCDEGNGQIGRRNKAVRKLWELDLVYLTWTEVPMDWNTIGSPQLLMLSGIGPTAHLAAHGIKPVVLDHPMVGQGMGDNPMNAIYIPSPTPVEVSLIQVVGITKADSYIEGASGVIFSYSWTRKFFDGVLNYLHEMQTSRTTTTSPTLSTQSITDFFSSIDPLLNATTRAGLILQKIAGPVSRGHLELRNTNPNDNPSVRFNYYQEPEDLNKCVDGMNTIFKVINSKAFSKFKYPDATIQGLLDLILSVPTNLRPRHLASVFNLKQFCIDTVMTIWHYHGGCQVGRVVDKNYKVLGIDSLRVIDGSTFLKSPGTNPQATVMMLGRYMGQRILQERALFRKKEEEA